MSGPTEQHGRVERTERLTPGMVRIVFGGPGLSGFEPTGFTDEYVKVELPVEGAQRPASRRYTIRSWDPIRREATIDFMVHGDTGVMGRWADAARPGDVLAMAGPSGGYRPDTDADWYLMAGDESALPAIASSLEAVPPARKVLAVLVVDDAQHELDLHCPGDLDLTWVHREDHSDPSAAFLEAVVNLDFPEGRVSAFVHGEAAETRAIRRHLLAERTVERESLSVSPYWRRGHTDEAWRQVKRDWMADVERDVPIA